MLIGVEAIAQETLTMSCGLQLTLFRATSDRKDSTQRGEETLLSREYRGLVFSVHREVSTANL